MVAIPQECLLAGVSSPPSALRKAGRRNRILFRASRLSPVAPWRRMSPLGGKQTFPVPLFLLLHSGPRSLHEGEDALFISPFGLRRCPDRYLLVLNGLVEDSDIAAGMCRHPARK